MTNHTTLSSSFTSLDEPTFEIRVTSTGAVRETVTGRVASLRRQDWFCTQDRVAHHIVPVGTV